MMNRLCEMKSTASFDGRMSIASRANASPRRKSRRVPDLEVPPIYKDTKHTGYFKTTRQLLDIILVQMVDLVKRIELSKINRHPNTMHANA